MVMVQNGKPKTQMRADLEVRIVGLLAAPPGAVHSCRSHVPLADEAAPPLQAFLGRDARSFVDWLWEVLKEDTLRCACGQ